MTERQRGENLHRDRYQKDISEERRGDREWRSYIGISPKRERGRKEKRKSRDLSNRSLRQTGRQRVENLHRDLLKEGERGKREQRPE